MPETGLIRILRPILFLLLPGVFLCGLAALYFFCPKAWTVLGTLFAPDRVSQVRVSVDGRETTVPVFGKRHGHIDDRGKEVPVLVMCGIPCKNGRENLKIFPDGLGVFQDAEAWFCHSPRYLYLRSCARLTMPLEDDMKGWNTEYRIAEKDGTVHYEIFPAGPYRPHRIVFSIPKKMLSTVPPLGSAGRYLERNGEVLRCLPYGLAERKKRPE